MWKAGKAWRTSAHERRRAIARPDPSRDAGKASTIVANGDFEAQNADDIEYKAVEAGHEKDEIIRGLVVVEVEQADEVVGERSLPTFRTLTGDGIAYLNRIPRDLRHVYL